MALRKAIREILSELEDGVQPQLAKELEQAFLAAVERAKPEESFIDEPQAYSAGYMAGHDDAIQEFLTNLKNEITQETAGTS